MYQLDVNFDLNSFVGKKVLQICYSASEISISWNNEEWLQFMGPFSINGKYIDVIYPVKSDFGLLDLIEKKVTDAKTNQARDSLILVFDNKYELVLIGNPFYESFILKSEQGTIIV